MPPRTLSSAELLSTGERIATKKRRSPFKSRARGNHTHAGNILRNVKLWWWIAVEPPVGPPASSPLLMGGDRQGRFSRSRSQLLHLRWWFSCKVERIRMKYSFLGMRHAFHFCEISWRHYNFFDLCDDFPWRLDKQASAVSFPDKHGIK